MSMFKKATRQAARLRMALAGPPGSGKTYTALMVAAHLGGRVAVIDTEHGSASKYAPLAGQAADPARGLFDFEVVELENFHPMHYVAAILAAEEAGFDTVLIDSLSHAWAGKGGGLELHDMAVAKQKTKNTYTAWAEVTSHHNALIDAVVQSKCHIIATMRAKMDYVQEKDERTGRTTVRKVGLAPVQREGMEYEFDVIGDIDIDHTMVVSKSRCSDLADKVFKRPGKDVAIILKAWLGRGPLPAPRPAATKQPDQPAPTPPVEDADLLPGGMTHEQHAAILAALQEVGGDAGKLCTHYHVGSTEELLASDYDAIIKAVSKRKRNGTHATDHVSAGK